MLGAGERPTGAQRLEPIDDGLVVRGSDFSFPKTFGFATSALVSTRQPGSIPPSSELIMVTSSSLGLDLFRLPPFRTLEPALRLTAEFVRHFRQGGIMAASEDSEIMAQPHQKLDCLYPFQNCVDVRRPRLGRIGAIDHDHKLDQLVADALPQGEFKLAGKILRRNRDPQQNVIGQFVNRQMLILCHGFSIGRDPLRGSRKGLND